MYFRQYSYHNSLLVEMPRLFRKLSSTLRVMSYIEGSVVLAVGNFLLLVSLLYILIYVGSGYMQYQTW